MRTPGLWSLLFPFLLLAIFPTFGCGSRTETIKIKDYRLAMVDKRPLFAGEFKQLAEEFNQQAGLKVLTFEQDASQANSAIIVTKGLKAQTGGKIGLGQWISQIETDNSLSFSQQVERTNTVRYSMRLEFDADYIEARLGRDDPVKRYEKQKLFFHEVGHGLEMDHEPNNPQDVMYPDVSGDKDFDKFFERVKAYMQDLN